MNIGDLVALKSGGPVMVIAGFVREHAEMAICMWFNGSVSTGPGHADEKWESSTDTFHVDMLVSVEVPEGEKDPRVLKMGHP